MEINQITQMIIEFAPVITALIGVMVSLIVGISRIKNSNTNTYNNIRRENEKTIEGFKEVNQSLIEENAHLREANEELRLANEELREDLRNLMLELHNIHVKSKKKVGE